MGGPGMPRFMDARGSGFRVSPDNAGSMKRLARDKTRTARRCFSDFQEPDLRSGFARSVCLTIFLAALSGCGLAEFEQARLETGEVERQVSALRGSPASALGGPQAGPRLSTVRLIERRPYVGLTRIEPDPRADLPPRFRRADAVNAAAGRDRRRGGTGGTHRGSDRPRSAVYRSSAPSR